MTGLPPLESVATMSGRELDALIHRHFYGFDEVVKHPLGWLYRDRSRESFISGHWHPVPCHSSDKECLFALFDAMQSRGHFFRIANSTEGYEVVVWPKRGGLIGGNADTLPLAFARAALMTCYRGDE